MDALVVVNQDQDNPLVGLNAQQLDAILAITRRCGGRFVPKTWGDLQLNQPGWAPRGLQRFGRNSAFLRLALSPRGQALVSPAGYLPLSDAQMAQARALLTS